MIYLWNWNFIVIIIEMSDTIDDKWYNAMIICNNEY